MEEEYAKSLKELQILAGKKQITIPVAITKVGEDAYDKLKLKFGVDFDNEYCDMMVKDHKDTIIKFEKASADAKDSDITSWATNLVF